MSLKISDFKISKHDELNYVVKKLRFVRKRGSKKEEGIGEEKDIFDGYYGLNQIDWALNNIAKNISSSAEKEKIKDAILEFQSVKKEMEEAAQKTQFCIDKREKACLAQKEFEEKFRKHEN